MERVDAEGATLRDGYWRLKDANVVTPGFDTVATPSYLLATNLTKAEVAQAFVAPETVSFWTLPALAAQTDRAGLDATGYRLRFQELLALPADAGGDGSGGRVLFVKILPNGRRPKDGFRWRRGRLRALCRDEIGQ